ncbi:wolbachia palindromic element domain protein, partial [Wolbachia pipientis wVitA]|jgi:hypothetical protein
MALLH